jgi:hypothetical protein
MNLVSARLLERFPYESHLKAADFIVEIYASSDVDTWVSVTEFCRAQGFEVLS